MKHKEKKEDFYIKLKDILAQKRVMNFSYNSKGDILLKVIYVNLSKLQLPFFFFTPIYWVVY